MRGRTPTALHAAGDPIVLDDTAAQRGILAVADDPTAPGMAMCSRPVSCASGQMCTGALERAAGTTKTRRAEVGPPDGKEANTLYGAGEKKFHGVRESVDPQGDGKV